MFLDAVLRTVASEPDAVAVVSEDGATTYAELDLAARSLAAWLVRAGLAPDQTVGIAISDESRHLTAALALLHLGCPQVTLPAWEPAEARRSLAARTGAAAVLVQSAGAADGAAPEIVPDFGWCLGSGETWAAPARPRPDDVALWLTTSGTTGRAKIIPLTARQMLAQALDWQWPRGRTVVHRPTPIEFNNSKRQRLYVLAEGGTNVFANPARREIGETCERRGVTRLAVSAMQARTMIERRGGAPAPLPAFTHLRTGGSAVPADLRRAIRETLTPRLHVAYATSEFGAIATAGPDEADGDGTTAGRVHADVTLEIVDEDGRPLPQGATGAIRVRSPGMALRYHDDEEATRRAFRDGWFHPGDVGRIDERGALHVLARADDMMNLAGINVFPAEIERVVRAIPGVLECAAFPLRSAAFGDVPVVAAVAQEGLGEADVLARARAALGVRAPRRVVFVGAIPRNAGGKVDCAQLRETLDALQRRTRGGAPA